MSESKNRMTLQTNWHTETAAEARAVLLRSPALTSGSAAEAGSTLERARGGAADAAGSGSEWSRVAAVQVCKRTEDSSCCCPSCVIIANKNISD